MWCACRSVPPAGTLITASVDLISSGNSSYSATCLRFPYSASRHSANWLSLSLKPSQSVRVHDLTSAKTIEFRPSRFHSLVHALQASGGLCCDGGGDGGGKWNNPFQFDGFWWWDDGGGSSFGSQCLFVCLLLCSMLCCFCHFQLASALAAAAPSGGAPESLWEVRGGKWIQFTVDALKDEFIGASLPSSVSSQGIMGNFWSHGRDIIIRLMLPEGFPDSVTEDYLDYSLWRGVQGIASQISGVLATQALLYAIGLGKGAIPTAAAINWVLKDGIGYLSKILLSNFGRHFDVNPKGWRLFADLLENAAFGLEMLTPAFPHLFVVIGAAAGAGRSAAALIQAATRSCFYAGFAAQRNFAEVEELEEDGNLKVIICLAVCIITLSSMLMAHYVIAKGEAQGMVSKFIGIMIGIALAKRIGSSTSLALATFGVVTWVHMFCNLKSYQSIKLRTLNPYRASLVFSEYLLSGQVPTVKDVNDTEPIFPAVPFSNVKYTHGAQSSLLSAEATDAASEIDNRLQLGSSLSDIVSCEEDVIALFNLYKNEGYILAECKGRYCVVLYESSSLQDMLKSVFHANYLHWLEKNAGIKARSVADDCKTGGRLQVSLEYVKREFDHVKKDGEIEGWATDRLIARPLPIRICQLDAATLKSQ